MIKERMAWILFVSFALVGQYLVLSSQKTESQHSIHDDSKSLESIPAIFDDSESLEGELPRP